MLQNEEYLLAGIPDWNSGIAHKYLIDFVGLQRKMMSLTFQGQNWPVPRDLDLRSNFDLCVFRSIRICLDASRCEEHDGGKVISISLLGQRLLVKKTFFAQNSYFDISWPPKPYLLKLDQFWLHNSERTVQMLSIAFPLPTIHYSFWDNGTLPEKYGISLMLTFDDLWWPLYWPGRKYDRRNFNWNCCKLSNAVYRIYHSWFPR